MNRSGHILSPVVESSGYRYPNRHRNSSPSIKPRQYHPRRSCDGHFAFLTANASSSSSSPSPSKLTNNSNNHSHNFTFDTDGRGSSPVSSSTSTSSISPSRGQSMVLNGFHQPQSQQQYHYHINNDTNRHYQHQSSQQQQHRSSSLSTGPTVNPQVQRTQQYFRPRVNTLPDALSGIVLNVIETDRRARSRSQSYTPPTSNNHSNHQHTNNNYTTNGGGGVGRKSRRKSQERVSYSDADSWTNYRKTSIDPRKFSISEVHDDSIPERDDKSYRVLVLGADKVGKTTLLHQLIRQEEMEKLSHRERSIKMLIPIDNVDVSIIFDNQPFNDDLLNDRMHHEKVSRFI